MFQMSLDRRTIFLVSGYVIPGHHGVPASQSGGVQLKDGGDVHAIRNRHQSVHDLFLWSSQTTS